jgi:hypothetical protein
MDESDSSNVLMGVEVVEVVDVTLTKDEEVGHVAYKVA